MAVHVFLCFYEEELIYLSHCPLIRTRRHARISLQRLADLAGPDFMRRPGGSTALRFLVAALL
jgi:hypothetical protein